MRLEPLLTAEETRVAESAHAGPMSELMERAGAVVADIVLRRFPGRVTVGLRRRGTTAATARSARGSSRRAAARCGSSTASAIWAIPT